jgi:hypothetical protein
MTRWLPVAPRPPRASGEYAARASMSSSVPNARAYAATWTLATGGLRLRLLLVDLRRPRGDGLAARSGPKARDRLPRRPAGDGEGEKETPGKGTGLAVVAGGAEKGKGVAGTVGNALVLLEGVLRNAPPSELKALLERMFSGEGLYLYVR